jgi:hypothetical protein
VGGNQGLEVRRGFFAGVWLASGLAKAFEECLVRPTLERTWGTRVESCKFAVAAIAYFACAVAAFNGVAL